MIYGIVLLSDGLNEADGGPSEADMLSRLPFGTEASSVKIYTIAYGDDADFNLMATLANRTNGQQFEGTVEDIEKISKRGVTLSAALKQEFCVSNGHGT